MMESTHPKHARRQSAQRPGYVASLLIIATALVTAGIVVATLPLSHKALAGDAATSPDQTDTGDQYFHQTMAPLLKRFCTDCHGSDTQEASIRIDTLDPSLSRNHDIAIWQDVLNMLNAGKMPPADAEQPSDAERVLVIDWLTSRLQQAAEAKRLSRSSSRIRRMTVDEYNFTMQSLFNVNAQFAETLPPDPISHEGFQNDSALLDISALQMEYYLEIARTAVSRYVRFSPIKDEPLLYHIELEDLFYTVKDRYETCTRAPLPLDQQEFAERRRQNNEAGPSYTFALSPIPPGDLPVEGALRPSQPKLHQQFLPVKVFYPVGEMIVRIKAAATPGRDGSIPRMRVECGMAYGDGDGFDAHKLGEVDVTAPKDQPVVYEFRIRMEDAPKPRNPESVDSLFDMLQIFISNVSRNSRAIYDVGPGTYDHPNSPASQNKPETLAATMRDREKVQSILAKMEDDGLNLLHLDSVEIEITPYASAGATPTWLVNNSAGDRPEQQTAVARNFLRRFMEQAYRRPVADEEFTQKVTLFEQFLSTTNSFENSLRETLVSVLVSPHFLFLESTFSGNTKNSKAGPTPYQLASRLSYLLWRTMPDEQLLKLAATGQLTDIGVLNNEASRMLDDSRSDRFLESFCHQWLRLDRFPHVAVSPEYFPKYDDDLGELTLKEPVAFFTEVFRAGAPATDLIDSNYAMLNARLAQHYGLPVIAGDDLRKVELPEDSIRGGVLTQAALLTMNSDGVDSHPIRRGVWILERMLNDPPPPPPPNVPDIDEEDPDFRGLSLKERIEKHREPGSCRNCHEKIDPWGIALENFGATGRYRPQVKLLEEGRESRRSVDSNVHLPDGLPISGVRDLRKHLLQQKREQCMQAIAYFMLTYALGRPVDIGDRRDLEKINVRFADSGYDLRELLLAIVESDAFLH